MGQQSDYWCDSCSRRNEVELVFVLYLGQLERSRVITHFDLIACLKSTNSRGEGPVWVHFDQQMELRAVAGAVQGYDGRVAAHHLHALSLSL